MTDFKPTPRTRVKRMPKRGHYDRDTVHAILDAAFICHVGYVIDGSPYVTATSYWRDGDGVYWHGSSASRMIRAIGAGIPVCLNVSLIDGLVLARSGFHHSVNYRTVMLFGNAQPVTDPGEKLRHLDMFVERLYPGRTAEVRRPTKQELKATTVLGMPIAEAVAKVRTGPPIDDDEDYGTVKCWAGVLPLHLVTGTPVDDGRLLPGVRRPAYVDDFAPARSPVAAAAE